MKKTYLNELTRKELENLFRKNEHLKELANELHRENVVFWIGEELGVFKDALSDWRIGFDCYNHIRIKDSSLFIRCYKDYIDAYSSDNQTIELVNEAIDYLLNNNEDDDYDEKIDDLSNKLKNRLIEYFNNCAVDNDDEDELIEHLIHNDILGNYYRMDDKLFIIYEEIIKVYE